MSKIDFVGDDDGNRLLGVDRCVDAYVPDEIARLVDRFKTFERDVLCLKWVMSRDICIYRTGIGPLTSPLESLIRFLML